MYMATSFKASISSLQMCPSLLAISTKNTSSCKRSSYVRLAAICVPQSRMVFFKCQWVLSVHLLALFEEVEQYPFSLAHGSLHRMCFSESGGRIPFHYA